MNLTKIFGFFKMISKNSSLIKIKHSTSSFILMAVSGMFDFNHTEKFYCSVLKVKYKIYNVALWVFKETHNSMTHKPMIDQYQIFTQC